MEEGVEDSGFISGEVVKVLGVVVLAVEAVENVEGIS